MSSKPGHIIEGDLMNFDKACELAKGSGNQIISTMFKEHWKGKSITWDDSGEGFICVAPKEIDGKIYSKVYYLVVSPSHRRKGIASKLLNLVKGNVLYVTEEGTPGTDKLCKANGFKKMYKKLNEFGSNDVYYSKSNDTTANNGGPTGYYDCDPSWKGAGDIIEGRDMNFNQGSMFKVTFCFNIGRHSATDYERELNKLIYFAKRELERIGNE